MIVGSKVKKRMKILKEKREVELKIIFLISWNKRSLLLKSIVNKIAIL